MTFEEPDGATPLDPDEMEGLRFKHISTRGELDELEQANITQGLRWLSRRRGGDILADDFVRSLHKRLFGDVWKWAGTYRLREKNIGIDPMLISVQLRYLLDDARYWAEHSTYEPLEAAARFHHRMVQIHPFPNGNGRHARISADIYLNDYFDLSPIAWASGFNLQADNERRSQYIIALRAADGGDFEPIISFVGGGQAKA
ncbi:mobile mystery protein B [Pontivivens nitratireducens]|uniref:Mobile mystery protein B n=1 Tax=Pontivivens nitratireducens TaxID=2758038 RepID=A0A6G7VMN6_9RHOB|nr:mobile mystery protein B [Pontibrevibacter nitratireducens]QIK41057.1 mobile mystery protein B [Pontibrevibacter nitratireducens]